MQAELTHQLGYGKPENAPYDQPNRRNGTTSKKVKSSSSELAIEIPRARTGEFEPMIIEKHQRRFSGFDENIISLYSRGLSTRDIQAHLEEIYGVEVSPLLISSVTDEIQKEVVQWQNRPLVKIYPLLFLDALRINVRKDGRVVKCAVYVAIGVNLLGRKECLGLWVSENEGARILACGFDGVEKQRFGRYSHLLCRRFERLPGSDCRSLSPNNYTNLHCPSNQKFACLCGLSKGRK